MFSSIYIFRVSAQNLDAFIEAQREAAAMYRDHGALEDATYVALDTTGKYDCDDFDVALPSGGAGDSVIVVGTDRFADKAAYERAMRAIDEDDRFHRLSATVGELLGDDAGLALRGEFERVV